LVVDSLHKVQMDCVFLSAMSQCCIEYSQTGHTNKLKEPSFSSAPS